MALTLAIGSSIRLSQSPAFEHLISDHNNLRNAASNAYSASENGASIAFFAALRLIIGFGGIGMEPNSTVHCKYVIE